MEKQINLSKENTEKKRDFLRRVFDDDNLHGSKKFFDKIEGWDRVPDESMNVEEYINHIKDETFVSIQVGYYEPGAVLDPVYAGHFGLGAEDRLIRIAYASYFPTAKNRRHAWIMCPYSMDNLTGVMSIFSGIFGRKMNLGAFD